MIINNIEIKISNKNLKIVEDWVNNSKWVKFMNDDKKTRSSTSITLVIKDEWFKKFNEDEQKDFININIGIKTLTMMKAVSSELIKDCLKMDPIQTAELMTETNDFYYCPYIYGFSNYSRKKYRKNILKYI